MSLDSSNCNLPIKCTALKLSDAENQGYLENGITYSPLEGVIEGCRSGEITFNFSPKTLKRGFGFNSNTHRVIETLFQTKVRLNIMNEDCDAIKVSLVDQPIDFVVSGKACLLNAKISEEVIDFTRKLNEHEREIEISNRGLIGFCFQFDNLPNFLLTPKTAKLMPGESKTILVIFKPNQIGFFDLNAICHLKTMQNQKISRLHLKLIGRHSVSGKVSENLSAFTLRDQVVFSETQARITNDSAKMIEERRDILNNRKKYAEFLRNPAKNSELPDDILSDDYLQLITPRDVTPVRSKKSSLYFVSKALSKLDLDSVIFSCKTVDFGDVYTHSTKKIHINIQNAIESGDQVQIAFISEIDKTKTRPLISVSPEACIIAKGKSETFTIICHHNFPGLFQATLRCLVNNRHSIEIPVSINLQYFPVKLSKDAIHFKTDLLVARLYNEDIEGLNSLGKIPVYEDNLELLNPANYEMLYEWETLAGSASSKLLLLESGTPGFFSPLHASGKLSPGQVASMNIMYFPGTSSPVASQILNLVIYEIQATNRVETQRIILKCTADGQIPKSKLLSNLGKNHLDFGSLCIQKNIFINAPCVKIAKIKNCDIVSSYFFAFIQNQKHSGTIKLKNNYGFILPNETEEIQIIVYPIALGDFCSNLIVTTFEGGNSFKIPIKFSVATPQIIFKEIEKFQTEVNLGLSSTFKVNICNQGETSAILLISSLSNPYFKFSIPQNGKVVGHNAFTIEISPVTDENIELIFSPLEDAEYSGKITIAIVNSDEILFEIPIITKGVNPKIRLNRNHVEFEDVLIYSAKNIKHRIVLKETVEFINSMKESLDWYLEMEKTSEPSSFSVDPRAGTLKAGETQTLTILFAPLIDGLKIINAKIRIFGFDDIRLNLTMTGKGLFPGIEFEPSVLYLPIVPLQEYSYVFFNIINRGCDIKEIVAIISEELQSEDATLEILFSEGSLLKKTGERLQCTARFANHSKDKTPISFTTRVQFCGINLASYYLEVRGTSASSLLTLTPFIFERSDKWCFAINEQKQITFIPRDKKELNIKNRYFGPRTPTGFSISNMDAKIDLEKYLKGTILTVLTWFNHPMVYYITNIRGVEKFPSIVWV